MKRQDLVIPLISNSEVYDLQTNRAGVKRYIQGFSPGFSGGEDDPVKWRRQIMLEIRKSCRENFAGNFVFFVKTAK